MFSCKPLTNPTTSDHRRVAMRAMDHENTPTSRSCMRADLLHADGIAPIAGAVVANNHQPHVAVRRIRLTHNTVVPSSAPMSAERQSVSLFQRPRRQAREANFQASVVEFLRWALPSPGLVISVPNERIAPSKGELAKLIRMGLRPGCPDLMVFPGGGRVIGLELKPEGGVPTTIQKLVHQEFAEAGVPVVVACGSLEEVRDGLEAAGVTLNDAVELVL